MRKLLVVVGMVCLLSTLVGCVMPKTGNIFGMIQDTQGTMMLGDTSVGQSKVGTAVATGMIIIASGDTSIKSICDRAGITKIHHVDTEELNILNIYCKVTVKVYGE